jgi:hypothetical protein
MKTPPAPTTVEKVAGSLPAQAVATSVAVFEPSLLTALLPVLLNSLASSRQRGRVEIFLADVSLELKGFEEKLRDLSDAQYKLINEAVLAALHTTELEKLRILRAVVRQTLDMKDVEPQEAISLSRIIRDISAEEVSFVVKNFSYEGVTISNEEKADDGILRVKPGSRDELLVTGLFSLGVLTTGQPTLGQILGFSGITAKLITLLKTNNAQQ